MASQLVLAIIVVVASVAAAIAALLLVSLLDRRRLRLTRAQFLLPEAEPTIFLFEDRELVDATPPGKLLLASIPLSGDPWNKLAAFVTDRIPNFLNEMANLTKLGTITLASDDKKFRISAESVGMMARLSLSDLTCEGQGVIVDSLSLQAQEAELASLRELSDVMPIPVWRVGTDGAVLWANQSYLALHGNADGLIWPIPKLFEFPGPEPSATTSASRRVRIETPDLGSAWFDCRTFKTTTGNLNIALPADVVVRAEQSLRDFTQTLTKTFAHLSVGLAVFDRQRRLTLFNPALVDLTALGPDFLIARPTLFAFLDRMRDNQILPEPKHYTGWRTQMAELEKAATSGHYEETWALSTGQTYKVTGRPHPDGAVAFLFEDISAEISMSRRFRAEIELGQTLIDALEDALAVFSESGILTMSNSAYGKLWGLDHGTTLASISIIDATRHWSERCLPTPVWGDLRDFVGRGAERSEWDADLVRLDGSTIGCRILPVAGGGTLVKFSRPANAHMHVRRMRGRRPSPPSLVDAVDEVRV